MTDQPTDRILTDDQLDQLVISQYPYPIAVNYQRLLAMENWERRTRFCLEVFEFGLRAITLGVLSQYCVRDVDQVSDAELDAKLARNLPRASLGQWVDFLFLSLRAYGGRRDLFFMPELYDFYWDTSQEPHEYRTGARGPFQRLVEIRNEVVHLRTLPDGEEEWEILGRQAMGHLRTILRRFSFLQDYDLIRITERQADQYEYERYTGQTITTHQGSLSGKDTELRTEWFYLCKQERFVLALHPLLIFWFEELELAEGGQQDAAVFSRLLKKTVEYVATVAREKVEKTDPDLVHRVWAILTYLKDRISEAQRRVEFSWDGLREAARELTLEHMGATRQKYDRDLYVQRQEIFSEFQRFLGSDDVCFVLTGKSGVGKSNFVLSLADEYADREDVGLLIYNSTRLSTAATVVQTISEDLGGYLELDGEMPVDLFAVLDRQRGMESKKLVVVFDAINENMDSRALLRRIDQMVGKVRYPWLKVVITSRPQAWRTMKRGLPLAENRYYRKQRSGDYWVEMEDFTIQMDPFPRSELPVVYGKYREAYDLQTEYDDLKASIREALRDPLILRLVAEINRGQAIPERIRLSDIYDQYMQTLLKTGILYEEDLLLLEQELVPLMIGEGHYANRVTAEQVHEASTRDGRPLWELIRSDDLLSPGKRINDSYVRLVDAEILTEQGTPADYEIAFKYERFYDYYGGHCLRTVLGHKVEVEERADAYRSLIDRIQDPDPKRECPFLWGPVHSALLFDLGDGRGELIIKLAQTIDQLTKELIVSVLTDYGEDERQAARTLCHQLLNLRLSPRWKRWLGRWVQLRAERSAPGGIDERPRRSTASDSQVHMAKKAAIEVGYGLHLQDVLEQAAYDNSAAVRAVAAQYIYYLWRDDQEKGFAILENISRQIPARWIIPNAKALESCLGATMMIIFWHYQDLDNRGQFFGRLQQIWKSPIEHILFLGRNESSISKSVKGWVRDRLLRFAVRLTTALAGRAEEAEIMFSLEDLRTFFPADKRRQQLFAKLAPHLDAVHAETDSLAAIEGDLVGLMQDRDLLSTYLAFAAIIAHLLAEPEPTLRLIQSLFEIGIENPPPPVLERASPAVPMVMILVWAPRNLLYGQRFTGSRSQQAGISEQGLEVMGTFIKRYEDRYGSRCSTTVKEYRFNELYYHTYFSYLATANVHTDLLDYILDKAIEEKDVEALARHILDLASIGSDPACGVPRAAVQALRIVLQKLQDTDLKDGLEGVMIDALSNLRAYYPDVVDDFLAELDNDEMPPEIKRAIRARGATESLGTMLGIAAAWFARDTLVDPDPFMRDMLKWLLTQATSCKGFNEWMRLLVKQTINVAYGEPVF